MAWPLNLSERFVWKVLRLVLIRTWERKKIVWGNVLSASTDHIFDKGQQNDKHTLQGSFFQDFISFIHPELQKKFQRNLSSYAPARIWSWKLQRTSCSHTKNVRPYACSVRCETKSGCCGSVEQLWSSFSHESKACSFLDSLCIIESRCFD